jgi:RNA recognition motif-containing protein
MVERLCVENVAPEVAEPDLDRLFSRYGPVNWTVVVRDPETLTSRGIAVVEMEEGATRAAEELDGTELAGQPLVVARMERSPGRHLEYGRGPHDGVGGKHTHHHHH